METITEKVNRYLANVSKGVVQLKPIHVAKIVEIIQDHNDDVIIKKSRFNVQLNNYELVREFRLQFDMVQTTLKIVKDSPPMHKHYRYDIPDLNVTLFSLNPNLFHR